MVRTMVVRLVVWTAEMRVVPSAVHLVDKWAEPMVAKKVHY